jgi:hypothetical protein
LIPRARQEAAPEVADSGDAGGSRPLRRRVRGATLRTTPDDAGRQTARDTVRPADAEAVRSALEEFEAAVERAHRESDSDTGTHTRPAPGPAPGLVSGTARSTTTSHTDPRPTPGTHPENDLPEGAEQ